MAVRSDAWAVKAHCEMVMHPANCMLNLSYNNKHLPKGRTLQYSDFQKFVSNLRKRLRRAGEPTFRYLVCGEYGEQTNRPHYHAILFNYCPEDLVFHHNSKGNEKLPMFSSKTVDELWGKGECFIGKATFESARYVAKYITKTLYGETAKRAYRNKKRPFVLSSRKPAIGIPFLEKFKGDVFPHDHVVIDQRAHTAPKSFLHWLKKTDPEMYAYVMRNRIKRGAKARRLHPEEFEIERRIRKEEYLQEMAERRDANKRL